MNHIWDIDLKYSYTLCGQKCKYGDYTWHPSVEFIKYFDCEECIKIIRNKDDKIDDYFRKKDYNESLSKLIGDDNE